LSRQNNANVLTFVDEDKEEGTDTSEDSKKKFQVTLVQFFIKIF